MIFRSPEAFWLLLILPLFAAGWFWRRGRLTPATLALRLLMAALVVLALANPTWQYPGAASDTTVILVDQSDSLGAAGKAALRRQASAIARGIAQGGANGPARAHVLFFGARIAAPPPDGQPDTADLPAVGPDATDIAGALRAARGLIGAGGGRVVLVSDGLQTRGDAVAEARALAAAGVPVDTVAQATPQQPEIWVKSVKVPDTLREGEAYAIEIVVGSTAETRARLRLADGAADLAAQEVTLTPGEHRFTLRARAGKPGIARLLATIAGQPDTVVRNNSAAATAVITPPPRILLVEGRGGGAAPLRVALRSANVESDVIEAKTLPVQFSELDAYDGVVLIDVPAGDLTLDQMTTLREFVRSEGRGLVATGGRSSFTLGAYKDTPLEEVLPVSMTPPPRPQRSDVTLLLIIDQSASMGSSGGISKFDMAKESAILATQALRDEDRIGVLAFDTFQQWAVEFQQLGTGLSLGQIQERISQIPLGGGTDIQGALAVGLDALERQPGQVRHAVLLTDGRSFSTTRGPYRDVIQRARMQNITLSAIAIGEDSDTQLLQELAELGAGRYHFASKPEDIPRLTLMESEIARTEPQVEGNFRAELSAPHPLLRDFAPNQIPNLEGYVATTLKPEAELVLKSPEEDPVLAVWQYGLGRAVAWTPSVEAPWAQSWQNWPEYGTFWAQIIRYTLPEPDSGPLQIHVTARADEVVLSADSLGPGGTTVDLADTEATVVLPDGKTRTVPLRQTGPGHYAQSVSLPADGPYAVEVHQRKGSAERMARAGYVQPYPAEYLPGGDGAALLKQIRAVTGGKELSHIEDVPSGGQQPGDTSTGLWTWLLLAAALLWPIEIAVRRGWLRWG